MSCLGISFVYQNTLHTKLYTVTTSHSSAYIRRKDINLVTTPHTENKHHLSNKLYNNRWWDAFTLLLRNAYMASTPNVNYHQLKIFQLKWCYVSVSLVHPSSTTKHIKKASFVIFYCYHNRYCYYNGGIIWEMIIRYCFIKILKYSDKYFILLILIIFKISFLWNNIK